MSIIDEKQVTAFVIDALKSPTAFLHPETGRTRLSIALHGSSNRIKSNYRRINLAKRRPGTFSKPWQASLL